MPTLCVVDVTGSNSLRKDGITWNNIFKENCLLCPTHELGFDKCSDEAAERQYVHVAILVQVFPVLVVQPIVPIGDGTWMVLRCDGGSNEGGTESRGALGAR